MKETLSLSWDAHQKNLCNGLSLLQQHGEFVDMTLAADGHHVKVHQMVLSLASPYIKALIISAQCPHPIIFLNNISYTTLNSMLEYIYRGEVHVPKEGLSDLIAAGKALHIRGLKEMNECVDIVSVNKEESDQVQMSEENENQVGQEEVQNPKEKICEVFVESPGLEDEVSLETDLSNTDVKEYNLNIISCNTKKKKCDGADVQYSISNQGNLQLIVNRYIYNLKYVQQNLNKYWRCVDYAYRKCPANVYTNDNNVVLKRRSTHNHPFHDAKILKKLRVNNIFKAFKEAQYQCEQKQSKDRAELINRSKLDDSE